MEPIDKEFGEQIRALVLDLQKGWEGKSSEQIVAQGKAFEAKWLEWAAAQETKSERLIKERTSRMPDGVLSGGEPLSLGHRIAALEGYKAAAAAGFAGKTRIQLTAPGRIRDLKAITTVSSGYPIVPVRVGHFVPPTLPIVMRDLLTVVSITGTNAIEYVIANWTYNADYQVAEGDKKAEGTVTYTDALAPVRTIAWFVKVSRQMMADVPYFASTVDDQLIYGVLKKEDIEILMGNNAAGHLNGIYPQAPTLPAAFVPGITNSADVLLSAVAYLASLGFRATAIVVNPTDWAGMQLAKTAQGVYLLGGPPASTASPSLWGVPVVPNFGMPAGQFLVGEFAPNATLFDREAVTVDIAYENEDDFVRNMVTIRAEERVALAVFRPTAFVKGALAVTP
jgi:HK97 family phage major capsid protein